MPKSTAQIDREIDDVLYAPGKHCSLSGSLCPNCLRYRYEHLLGNKTAAELGLSENQLRDQITSAKQLVREIDADKNRKVCRSSLLSLSEYDHRKGLSYHRFAYLLP